MGTTLNRHAYQRLIDEDLEWLLKQPRTLERDHIEAIVRASLHNEYVLRQAAEAAQAWIARVSNQYILGVDDPHDAMSQLRAALSWDEPINYMHEDDLPVDMPQADYDKWYARSFVPDGIGCRVGPEYPFK